MNNTITVRIPRELETELKKISRRERVPISDLVRKSLDNYVAIYHFRKLRAKVLPYAQARGFLTDDDVFRIAS